MMFVMLRFLAECALFDDMGKVRLRMLEPRLQSRMRLEGIDFKGCYWVSCATKVAAPRCHKTAC
jgi:hypothetical protein